MKNGAFGSHHAANLQTSPSTLTSAPLHAGQRRRKMRQVWNVLGGTKRGRYTRDLSLLDEMRRIGVPLRGQVSMARALVNGLVRSSIWYQEVAVARQKRSQAARALAKENGKIDRKCEQLQSVWLLLNPQKCDQAIANLVLRGLMARWNYQSAQTNFAHLAHVPVMHTKIANLPRRITARHLCEAFRHFCGNPHYGLVGQMLLATGLLGQATPKATGYRHLRQQVRRLISS